MASKSTWILNAIIYTQNKKREVIEGHLRIEDNRIVEIRRQGQAPVRLKKDKNTRVIDARGLTLFPGFIQAHIHLCQTLFRNQADDLELLDWLSKKIWVMEAAHTEETLHASALLGIHELLSTGTTCLLDMGTVRHTESIFQAVDESGIRASIGKCLMDHPKTTPPRLREPTEKALGEAVSLYQRWHHHRGDRIRVSYAPRFVISCTEQLLTHIGSIAQEQKALIHTHASENLKEIRLVKQLVGCENIEYLDQLGFTSPRLVLAHCVWLKPREKEILQRSGTHIVHCPSSNLKLASGIAHIPDLRKRGINIALGADGAPCNNSLNILTEMRLAALLHKPGNGPKTLRAQEVLDMATLGGAQALGWSQDIGSIEVGKKADLVAFDLNTPSNSFPAENRLNPESIASSLVYSTQASHLRWTMVDGRVLYKNGKVATIPTERLMKSIRDAHKTIGREISRILPHRIP